MRAATYFSAPLCSKGFQAFWASSACAASATSYPSCSAALLPWPSGFSWAAPVFKSGRPLLAFGSNSAVKRTASPPLTLAVRNLWTIQPPASFFLGYRCFYGMGYQLSHLRILYSRMPLKIATLPLAFRLLFGRFFVSQLTYLGCWHTGLCIIHHFPRGTVSELV